MAKPIAGKEIIFSPQRKEDKGVLQRASTLTQRFHILFG